MDWTHLIAESLSGFTIYTIFKVALAAVEAGNATETQIQLVSSIGKLFSEYKNQGLLMEMHAEATNISELQNRFEKKWGALPPGHVTPPK